MSTEPSVILDDIDAAVSRLSDFGRTVVRPVARAIRERVLLFASARHWQVVHHGSFVKWAVAQANKNDIWLVLDPLFPLECLGPGAIEVRFSRALSRDGLTINSGLPREVETLVRGKPVGVLDDAALSGGTLRHVESLVSRLNGRVTEFVVCASTVAGRIAAEDASEDANWNQFFGGDYVPIHLRDVCPGLPYSGKRLRDTNPIATSNGPVVVSVPPTVFVGPWRQLATDRGISECIRSARRNFAMRFSAALGRPAAVSDLPLLGANVSIPLYPNQSAAAETRLDTLFA